LYDHACNKGLIEDKVKFLKEGCPQTNVSKLTDREMSKLVKEIIESPLKLTRTLSKSKTKIVDYKTGRMEVWGTCSVCDKENYWENVKLFSSSFLACNKCGQRYNLILSDEMISKIDSNLEKLLDEGGKIALWGINYQVTNLFGRSKLLKNKNVYPVEISEMKRLIDLYGKEVNSPEIINSEKIKTVIVPIPAYINEITGRIKKNHKDVKKIIDICELINPNYKNEY
jgi:transcription elongation factor Elf1